MSSVSTFLEKHFRRFNARETRPLWAYFAQNRDSTTSYRSYSWAVPNEKMTWDKIDADRPTLMIESDASIVAPLIFA